MNTFVSLFRQPLGIVVVGGLMLSSLLTLLVIPVVYDLLDRKSDDFYVARGRLARARSEDELDAEGGAA